MKFLIALLFSVNAMAAFTPFPPAAPPANSITAKGNLLTSNGSAQTEFAACTNDEILVWDAAELTGMKCEAKPVDTNAGTICSAGEYLDGDGSCQPAGGGGGGGSTVSSIIYFYKDSNNVCYASPCVVNTQGDFSVSSMTLSGTTYTINIPNGSFAASSRVHCIGTGMPAASDSTNRFLFGAQKEQTLNANSSGGASIQMEFLVPSTSATSGQWSRGLITCTGIAP